MISEVALKEMTADELLYIDGGDAYSAGYEVGKAAGIILTCVVYYSLL